MLDVKRASDDIEIVPVKKLKGRVAGVFAALGKDFVTQAVDVLRMSFEGIENDIHAGYVRRSSSREPWYPRGTPVRNERQLSIIAPDELDIVATAMGISEIKPEWIGANLALEGVPRLSMLPSGTLLLFENGVTIKVDAQNAPCRIAGKSIAEQAGMADIDAGARLFPKVAKRLRGLVAWVEKPGTITSGEAVSVRVPAQWVYRS